MNDIAPNEKLGAILRAGLAGGCAQTKDIAPNFSLGAIIKIIATRLKALQREWERHPPMPLLFASWLGVKPKEYGTAEELAERIKGL